MDENLEKFIARWDEFINKIESGSQISEKRRDEVLEQFDLELSCINNGRRRYELLSLEDTQIMDCKSRLQHVLILKVNDDSFVLKLLSKMSFKINSLISIFTK